MTAPTTEERRKSERRVDKSERHPLSNERRTFFPGWPDRRATERERQQKHYGAMLEDSRDMVDARRYRWLRDAGLRTHGGIRRFLRGRAAKLNAG